MKRYCLICALALLLMPMMLTGIALAQASSDEGVAIPFKYDYDEMTTKNFNDPDKAALSLKGNVVLTRNYVSKDEEGKQVTGTYILKAETVDYVFATGVAIAEGNVSVTDGKATITSNEAVYNSRLQSATFTGDVRATWGTAGRMNENESKGSKGRLIVLFDDVGQVKSMVMKGRGTGIYFPDANKEINFPGGTSAGVKPNLLQKPATQ